jgi:hypothetical protein
MQRSSGLCGARGRKGSFGRSWPEAVLEVEESTDSWVPHVRGERGGWRLSIREFWVGRVAGLDWAAPVQSFSLFFFFFFSPFLYIFCIKASNKVKPIPKIF